ncbi:MAG: hypothetical protein WCI73_18030, partial [Phycisphaerae bacterium]
MPQFLVNAPDGSKYRVNAPDGATEDDAVEYVKANRDSIKPEDPGIVDKVTRAAGEAVDEAGKAVADAGRGGIQALRDAGGAIKRAGQRLGVLADEDEERYVTQRARNPAEADAIRAQYRKNKYAGGSNSVMPGTARAAVGSIPTGEINRPSKTTEQVNEEIATANRAAAVDAAMRGDVGIRRKMTNLPIVHRDAAQANRTNEELAKELRTPTMTALSNSVEGRIQRNVNQGMLPGQAAGKAHFDISNNLAERPLEQTKTDEQYASDAEMARQSSDGAGSLNKMVGQDSILYGAGAAGAAVNRWVSKGGEAVGRGARGALEMYSDLLGTEQSSKLLAEANQRSRERDNAAGKATGIAGQLEG